MKVMRNKKAQASLELSVSIICTLLLVFACFRIFLWAANQMVHRQEDYETPASLSGRLVAGSVGSYLTSIEVDDATQDPVGLIEPRYPKLKILGND